MCVICINVTGFTGDVRFNPWLTNLARRPFASRKTTNVQRKIKDRGATQGDFSAVFHTALRDVCQLQRGCHIGRFRSRLGERIMGASSSQILSTQHAHDSSRPQPWKAAVREPTWSVKSLLALGQWSAQSYYAHICHTGAVTLSENVMLRVGKAVNILPIVLCTNA